MEVEEEHVHTLLSMGFPESEIRRALRRAKNDLNEAVAYLTNDQTLPSDWEEVDDVEMKDIHSRPSQTMYSPSPPPSYDDVHAMEQKTDENGENGGTEEENPLEFPVTNLYELEGRVFAEHWSIPYKKEESLGKCLIAATRLAEANLTENDEHCRRFLERCMPESFQKLMTSGAVHRWNAEIQEGIFNMAELFIDMCVARLQHLPIHHEILNILTLVFNKESEFHFKNRSKRDRTYWEDKLEDGQLYTANTGYKSSIDPYGWLTHAINRFAFKGGFNVVRKLLENEELDAPSMAALLRPFGMCAEFLNPKVVTEILAPGMEKTIKYIQNLEEKDLKEKKIGSVSDLLASMKLLCIQMWPQHTESLDDLRLEVALRMLKSPHFNARMNALKEVTKLIEDATSNKVSKTAIDYKTILHWLVENKVLSIALEGNIDQVQYCEKVKGIVDFLGSEITIEELAMIWKMQCHGNETLGSVRGRIANKLRQPTDNVQIVAQDKMLDSQKDQKLLHQLEFEDNQLIQVRLTTPTLQPLGKEPMTPTSKQSFDLEQEKMLPGVVMAVEGQVFDMLYQLADLDESRITHRVRKLLMLIPTDPQISETLECIANKVPKQCAEDVSPRASPRKSTSASPLPSPRMSPKEVLKSLFDATAQDMSAFRVLYNLEVLSSKLMPISVDLATRISSQAFCDDFLSVGGLQMVVNVLQAESLAPEVNYTIRQGCYAICLQLARFLLCGQTVSMDTDEAHAGNEESKTASNLQLSSSPANSSFNKHSAGSHAVQTMDVHTFTETVSCFLRVTWAAAAGRLHLIGTSQVMIDSSSGHGRRSRQSSTGSTASTGSESDCQSLHAGVCAKARDIPTKDCNIAREALEILITCLQIRCELIASFYSLPCSSDFIIDILVGCTNADIRSAALEQFFLLSQTECTAQRTPHHFMLQLLLKAYVPFWVSSSSARGVSQRLLGQCSQYFDLLCKLLEGLSTEDQGKLQMNPTSMLEDEVAWLGNFVPSIHPDMSDTDNSLLAGHLKLISTLLTCEGVDPEENGRTLVYDILHDFLFPASKVMMDSMNTSNEEKLEEVNPKCGNCESRVAAYRLLIELAKGNYAMLKDVCKQLIEMHHLPQPDCANEWEYLPPVDGRARCGFVGLKNGGATCYMNSVIQQLYMVPGIPEVVLGTEEDKPDEESVFFQIQQVLGHLLESKLQYHEPERFWKVFKLWGQTVNIREQQDAFDFFQALIDQIDEHLKRNEKLEIFKRKFQGIFSDQKICKDCPHRYEREEAFLALNLTVKNATLQDSLDQFVKGELLEGDNAYFCDKCGEKRNTMKRMCIKTLPPLLCIQLKRFGYDWEANRALKFDDYFKFPWILDMEPYTTDGMARREEVLETVDSSSESDSGESSSHEERVLEIVASGNNVEQRQINYELVGIVVHSGQANAGHYYSFIKDRRGDMMSNPQKGKWFKFNDTVVEEFEMTEDSLEAECFGGTYKAKILEPTTTLPDERVRYWNGYMLFYEKMEEPAKTPVSAKKSKIQTRKAIPEGGKGDLDSNSFMELTELVHKGEKKGIFMDEMPASIHQIIQAENLTFVKNRDVYNTDYFRFIRDLVAVNMSKESHKDFQQMSVTALQLGIRFLFNTFFRCKKKTKTLLDEWVDLIDEILEKSKEACDWLVEYLSGSEGSSYIKPFLLECPCRDVRYTMARLLERIMSSHFRHGGVPTQKCFNEIVEIILHMLSKDVVDHCKNSYHYFQVIKSYVQLGTKSCSHMFLRQGFQRLIGFLIGNSGEINQGHDTPTRRWSSIQSREFGNLHASLAILVLNCDVSKYRREDPGDYEIRKPKTVFPMKFLFMPQDMENYVFGAESSRYLREVIHAIREVGTSLIICDMLIYCSFCNYQFSENVLKLLMHQYMTAPSNELKPVFSLLTELLMLEDPVQGQRIKVVIDGVTDSAGTAYDGLLATVRLNHATDSRRSYTCIKFLVSLASKSAPVKDYLMQIPSKWQWAVNWLKKKMSEYYYTPSSTSAISNEDSNRKSFQRTYSAQSTLEEAKALLTELEYQEGSPEMDTNDEEGQSTAPSKDEVDDSNRKKT
eukprot:XP_011414140.1 PREDICTED: ubiquitin carboxyl-terminal hydrolase 24 [Crassostrea gigas]